MVLSKESATLEVSDDPELQGSKENPLEPATWRNVSSSTQARVVKVNASIVEKAFHRPCRPPRLIQQRLRLNHPKRRD